MPIDWDYLRCDFPLTKKYVYLANAAISPIPIPVYGAISEFYQDVVNHGGTKWNKWITTIEETRSLYCKFIGADGDDEIAFTHSTSEGMNIIAHMLSNKGIAISNKLEFPSSNLPWLNQDSNNLKFVVSTNSNRIRIEDIEKMIDKFDNHKNKKVKTIITSHVQYSTGFRQDLKELGKLTHRRGLHLVVNATQSLGALSFNARDHNVDFMVSNGHKWMLSTFGIGGIYIKRKYLKHREYFIPSFFSQSGQKQKQNFDNNTKLIMSNTATRFELGTPHFQNIIALNAAIKYMLKIGTSEIEKRILALTDYLIDRLLNMGLKILSPIENKKERSGIVIFKPFNMKPTKIVAELEKKNRIIVSARGKGIRVSPHFYNNESDIDKLILALDRIFKEGN
jgi:cysteine desulfurase / selenocysteine lyase